MTLRRMVPLVVGPGGRSLSIWADMSKNLRLKAVAFDIGVVLNPNPSANANDAVGKLGSQPPTSTTASPTDTTPTPSPATTKASKPVKYDGVVDPRSDPKLRYAEKLRMKTLKHDLHHPAHNPLKSSLLGSHSRWLIAEGMGDVLDYIYNRSMRLSLLGSPSLVEDKLTLLCQQLRPSEVAYVRPTLAKGANEAEWQQQSLLEMETALQLREAQVLLVSSRDDILLAARQRGYHTCRYRTPDMAYGQGMTDFTAANAWEVRDAVEALAGVALRDSVHR
eukprot:gene2271-2486_t